MLQCPSENTQTTDQSNLFDDGSFNWDPHRIGWAVAGCCTILTIIISLVSILQHFRNYTKPSEQRQILRILYMPPFYAIVSFFSFRYYRKYTYYSLIQYVWEALALGAFLILIVAYTAAAQDTLEEKGKRPLPFPLCFWRYRPSKEYFLYTIKWTVLQYVFVRVATTVIGIICEKHGILCESEGFNPHFASVYIEGLVFASISIALYGLLWFYGLMKDELATKRAFKKFLCIKLIVMLTFYQSFIISALKGRVIHGTEFWTATNIADGIDALLTCLEMVVFSVLMMHAYTAAEYEVEGSTPKFWRPLWDSLNFSDFWYEATESLRYYHRAYQERKALKAAAPGGAASPSIDRRSTPSAEGPLHATRTNRR